MINMNSRNKAIIKFSIVIIILITLIILFWKPLSTIFSSTEKAKEYVLSFGNWAPIIFILLIAAQVLLAPIPGQVAGLAGGYIFGAFLGVVYSIIGLIIGSFIAFYLSRKFGRPFVEKMVNQKTIEKFDNLVKNNGTFTLFIIYLLPALPDDAVSLLAGLTKIKIRNLILISTIGRLPGFIVLSVVGAGLASNNTTFSYILFIAMMLLSLILYLNKKRIENLMTKITESLNKTKK